MAQISTALVTGANRGLGLGFVKQLARLPSIQCIVAACRQPDRAKVLLSRSKDLHDVASSCPAITIAQHEVRDFDNYDALVGKMKEKIGDKGLNLIINNAGIMTKDSLLKVTPQSLTDAFHINTVGPVMLVQKSLPLLKQSAKAKQKTIVANISAIMASIEQTHGSSYPYRISKAALNMATRNMAMDLGRQGILVAAIHPGWVKTDLGGPNGQLTVDESVTKTLELILRLDEKSAGKFLNFDGSTIPW